MAHSSLSPATVLIGLLVVAVYQNRNRLLDMLDSRGAKGAVTGSHTRGGLDGEKRALLASLGERSDTTRMRGPLS